MFVVLQKLCEMSQIDIEVLLFDQLLDSAFYFIAGLLQGDLPMFWWTTN